MNAPLLPRSDRLLLGVRPRDRRTTAQRLRRLGRMLRSTGRYLEALKVLDRHGALSPTTGGELSVSWSQELLKELSVELVVSGSPPLEGPGMFVSNHLGLLDVLVWLAATPCCFLAKAAVAKAPLVGPGATYLGTVYVKRGSRGSRKRAREAIAQGVSEGRRVVVFPAGTTSLDELPWKPGAFEVAAEHGFPVQAACLSFSPLRRCAWLEEPFLEALWRVLEAEPVVAYVHFLPPVQITDVERDVPRLRADVLAQVRRLREVSGLAPEKDTRQGEGAG